LRPARLPIPPSGHSVELRCKDRQIFWNYKGYE